MYSIQGIQTLWDTKLSIGCYIALPVVDNFQAAVYVAASPSTPYKTTDNIVCFRVAGMRVVADNILINVVITGLIEFNVVKQFWIFKINMKPYARSNLHQMTVWLSWCFWYGWLIIDRATDSATFSQDQMSIYAMGNFLRTMLHTYDISDEPTDEKQHP